MVIFLGLFFITGNSTYMLLQLIITANFELYDFFRNVKYSIAFLVLSIVCVSVSYLYRNLIIDTIIFFIFLIISIFFLYKNNFTFRPEITNKEH